MGNSFWFKSEVDENDIISNAEMNVFKVFFLHKSIIWIKDCQAREIAFLLDLTTYI